MTCLEEVLVIYKNEQKGNQIVSEGKNTRRCQRHLLGEVYCKSFIKFQLDGRKFKRIKLRGTTANYVVAYIDAMASLGMKFMRENRSHRSETCFFRKRR